MESEADIFDVSPYIGSDAEDEDEMDVESEMNAVTSHQSPSIDRTPSRARASRNLSEGRSSLSCTLPTHPPLDMRPLTEDESKAVFSKLANYIVSACALYRRSTPD